MLSIGQERSRENAALAAEPGCAADSTRTKPLHSSLRDSERVSDSYNHRKAVAGALLWQTVGDFLLSVAERLPPGASLVIP